jgi:hypothetical protein
VEAATHEQEVPRGSVFKFSIHRMTLLRATFYRDKEAALEDARVRAGSR